MIPKKIFQIIQQEINPFVDAWEENKCFPAREVFKTLGKAGFLGVNKPTGELESLITEYFSIS